MSTLPCPPLLDAHALIRADDALRYPFQPLGRPLDEQERSSGLTHTQLLTEMSSCGVERAVVVQRGRLYGYDNRYVCDAAATSERRLQCICQVNSADPECGPEVAELISRHGAVGIRFMEPVKGDGLEWLDSPGAKQVWRTASEFAVPISVHFFGWNRLAGLEVLARRLSKGPIPRAVVLDSLGGIAMAGGVPDFGIDAPLLSVLEYPGTYLKLTAMTLHRLAQAKLSAEALILRLLGLVGAKRLLWGSDVLSPTQSYHSVLNSLLEATAALPTSDRAQILHNTASELYPLR